MLLYQILTFTIHGKYKKNQSKIINLKYQPRHGMENFNYLMGLILYQIFEVLFSILLKSIKHLLIIL